MCLCFPWPSGPKQILTWFTFPRPGFSKTCWGTFPSASLHQHVEKSRVTWPCEPNPVCASFPLAFWTQTNFDLGLLFLSLVSQKLVGYVSLSCTAPTCREELFHCASFLSVFWTQTILTRVYFPSAWILKNLLGYVSLSFIVPACREESFHSALRT